MHLSTSTVLDPNPGYEWCQGRIYGGGGSGGSNPPPHKKKILIFLKSEGKEIE